MAKIKYYYDTETCKYERVKTTTGDIILNLFGFLSVTIIFAFLMVLLYYYKFPSPKEQVLQKENDELLLYYKIIDNELTDLHKMMSILQKRDDDVYRVIFEAEPIPDEIRQAGVGGAHRYKELLESGIEQTELLSYTFEKLDRIKKQMYIQTKSYDEIISISLNKAKLLAAIPAMQPISNKELRRLSSGYGMRMHPLYKVRKMHWGIDFSAPRGTPIYATGDGKIKTVRTTYKGYGKHVVIDHGYGYQTRYGHMQSFNVRVGQRVKRGECIGFVGNTGTSSGPHVHYEVIKNNKRVNPIYYFFQDISEEEYDQLLELASIENQSMS